MGETEILQGLHKELDLDVWWHDLLGQGGKPDFAKFDLDKAIDTLPRTEIKAAEAIHEKFKNVLTYTEARDQWYLWDGRIHTPCDGEGVAIKIVKDFYRAMAGALDFIKEYIEAEAKKIESANQQNSKEEAKKMRQYYDKGEVAKHKRFRDEISRNKGQQAIIRSLRTECDVKGDYYDNDQRWLVVQNGVLDLDEVRNGGWAFLPHHPSRPVTKFFDAPYRAEALRSNFKHWDTFLKYSIPSDAAREYLQKVTGAAFMGESKLRTILNLHGPPGSGKSVFIGTFFKLGKGGAAYACMPDSKSIIKVSGQNFEQDSFKGRRFIGVSEPPMNDPIDNEFLKKFTGDDWVETRTLNVKSSGWVPQGVVYVASNKPLKINTRDKAIVERVQMIEFPIEFQKDHVDPAKRRVRDLEKLIMDDRERVLEWVIQGMMRYINIDGRQLTPPESVLRLQNEVVTDASSALRWLAENIEDEDLKVDFGQPEEYFLPVKDAFQRYQHWAVACGEKHQLPMRFFQQDIENRYEGTVRAGGMIRFKGIIMTPNFRRATETGGIGAINAGF
jgi:phage/plasmid-associated DNA primase